MYTTWVWCECGWVEYIDIGYSDYSGGTVDRSNIRTINKMVDEEGFVASEFDYEVHLGHLEREGSKPPAAPSYVGSYKVIPNGEDIVRYYGSHGTKGILVRLESDLGKIVAGIESYPLLDEEDHSRLEEEEAEEAWDNTDMRDRMKLLVKCEIHWLQARHDYQDIDTGNDWWKLRDYLLSR